MIFPKSTVMRLILSYNWLNISGLKGEGKTRFAMECASLFLERGYRLVTNVQSVWADDPEKIQPLSDGTYKIIVVLDEGGWYVRTLETISRIYVESHKMDVFWLSPSVMLPHEELWSLTCYPLFHIGIFYVWKFVTISLDTIQKGTPRVYFVFQIVSPLIQELYKTSAPGGRPDFILSFFEKWTEEYARRHAVESYGLRDLARPDSIRTAGSQGTFSKIAPLIGSGSAVSNKRKGK